MTGEFVDPKNMTIGSKNTSNVVKAAFYLFSFLMSEISTSG